ncbi:hypothetical protein MAHJHV63_49880 [Mycobacterium avium subsp. hominissuis]
MSGLRATTVMPATPSWARPATAAGITVVARNPDKAARLVRLGDELGVPTRFCALDGAGRAAR